MTGATDPYEVLGVSRGADDGQIHQAYRAAVRRTHPDAGGSSAEFEAVQAAYETLRDPARRGAASRPRTGSSSPRTGSSSRAADPSPPRPDPDPGPADAGSRMADLLAESRRLENEARRLAGLPPRQDDSESAADGAPDSLGAILRDAGEQVLDAARELRSRFS